MNMYVQNVSRIAMGDNEKEILYNFANQVKEICFNKELCSDCALMPFCFNGNDRRKYLLYEVIDQTIQAVERGV